MAIACLFRDGLLATKVDTLAELLAQQRLTIDDVEPV
jgi:hypothetical protein